LILPDAEALRLLLVFALIGAALGAAVFGGFSIFTRIPPRVPILTGAVFGVSITVVALMLSNEAPVSGLLAIVVFIFISPALGFFAAFLFDVVISNLFRHSLQPRMRRIFQPMQDLTAAFQAIGHGSNDGQHAAGVIAALFLSAGLLSTFSVSGWVIAASSAAIALGTLFGGWQVVEKLARRITRIRPYQGFSAGLAGGGTIWLATLAGIPISSTHVISGAIIGVGATRGTDAVAWGEVKGIVTAWIVTIPLGIAVAYLMYWLVILFAA
ncbi:MAG TPA: anion permease, partial [Methanomicrobiales archaeon]|nr:anion permease [Methanomicrobiales archaeon]